MTPQPGFVAKTRFTAPPPPSRSDSSTNNKLGPDAKLFINFCCHEAIGAPKEQTRLRSDGSGEQVGLHIPLSVGPAKADTDRSGAPCLVHDVIVHPDVMREAQHCDASGSYRHWLIELGLQYLERKEGYALSHQYRLPSMAYKGGGPVTSQRVRAGGSSRPEIAEVKQPADGSSTGASKPSRQHEPAAATTTK